MPVFTIQALEAEKPGDLAAALSLVGERLASAIETAPENVWVNFTPMAAAREGGARSHHLIVTVLANPRADALVARGLDGVRK